MNDAIDAVLLALIMLAFVGSLCGIIYLLSKLLGVDDWIKRRRKLRRKLRTPPCIRCAYYECAEGSHQCCSPWALERLERLSCGWVASVDAKEVRGTKQCRYKGISEEMR